MDTRLSVYPSFFLKIFIRGLSIPGTALTTIDKTVRGRKFCLMVLTLNVGDR
jgi:hypothetical protein